MRPVFGLAGTQGDDRHRGALVVREASFLSAWLEAGSSAMKQLAKASARPQQTHRAAAMANSTGRIFARTPGELEEVPDPRNPAD